MTKLNKQEQKAKYRDNFDVTFLSRDEIHTQEVIRGRNRARTALFRYMNKDYQNCGGFVGVKGSMNCDFFTYLTPDNIVIDVETNLWHDGEVCALKVGLNSFVTDIKPLSQKLRKLCLDAVFEEGYKLRGENR